MMGMGLGMGISIGGSAVALPGAAAILGPAVRGLYTGTSIQHSGSNVTSWTDLSGNGNHLTRLTGTPTFNASSAIITPNGPTLALGGAADVGLASFSLGPSGSPLFVACVHRQTGAPATVFFIVYNTGPGITIASGKPGMRSPPGTTATWGSAVNDTTVAVTGYMDGAVGPTDALQVEVGNGAPVATTFNQVSPQPGSADFRIGSLTGTSFFYTGEVAEVLIANVKPSAAQLTAMHAIWTAQYGV